MTLSKSKGTVWFRVAGLLLLLLWFGWLYTLIKGAAFVTDDDIFSLTARLVERPWTAFYANHFFEPYYFRPVGLVAWWVVDKWFGNGYWPQVLLNLILHASNCVLLFLLSREWGASLWRALLVSALYAVFPLSVTVAFWPSGRFDLLCVFFGLLLGRSLVRLMVVPQPVSGAVWLKLGLWTVLCCWSKEQGYAFIATLIGLLMLVSIFDLSVFKGSVTTRRRLLVVVLVLAASMLFAFFVRLQVLQSNALLVTSSIGISGLIEGVSVYFIDFPRSFYALFAGLTRLWLGLLVFVIATVLFAWIAKIGKARSVLPWRDRLERSSMAWSIPLVLLVSLLVAQAPITRVWSGLVDGNPFYAVTYARFHYAPFLCLLLVIAKLPVFAGAVTNAVKGCLVLGQIALLVVAMYATTQLAQGYKHWAQEYDRYAYHVGNALTGVIENQSAKEDCVLVVLDLPSKQTLLKLFIDAAAKMRVSPQLPIERVSRCVLMTESTALIYVHSFGEVLSDVGLSKVVEGGGYKRDQIWDGVLYRYRSAPQSWRALPKSTRFFKWNETTENLLDVSDAVYSGELKLKESPR